MNISFQKTLFLLALAFSLNSNLYAQSANPNPFRVVGYLPNERHHPWDAGKIDFNQITHLNIAFINPDSTGKFSFQEGLKKVSKAAHAKNVKVLASIGGGSAPAYYATLLNEENRGQLISSLLKICRKYKLDGIDVDLEGKRVDANYENFVVSLGAALKEKGLLMTAAIASFYKDSYTDKALAQYDFMNIMSYDLTGPWKPNNPGQHSPYSLALSDLDYFENSRGIAKEKLGVGVPFYAYGFGTNAPQSMSFKDVISKYQGSENADSVQIPGGGTLYYNGIPTIKSKTQLALDRSNGVMIWQLLQDDTGTHSLLSTINSVIPKERR